MARRLPFPDSSRHAWVMVFALLGQGVAFAQQAPSVTLVEELPSARIREGRKTQQYFHALEGRPLRLDVDGPMLLVLTVRPLTDKLPSKDAPPVDIKVVVGVGADARVFAQSVKVGLPVEEMADGVYAAAPRELRVAVDVSSRVTVTPSVGLGVLVVPTAQAAPRPGKVDPLDELMGESVDLMPEIRLEPRPPPSQSGDHLPPSGRLYTPVRITRAPVIDGKLDDDVWDEAPKDDRFLSTSSERRGQPTVEPTVVQLAYDAEHLYVAFRCTYKGPGTRDDAIPISEWFTGETVNVYLDPLHDHSSAYVFAVTRTGHQIDWELSRDGREANWEWRGIWSAAVESGPEFWTAEFKIPWGTVALPAHDKPFDIGLNFRRYNMLGPEWSAWAIYPPAHGRPIPSEFGHLVAVSDVKPGQRLSFTPYLVASFLYPQPSISSRLRNFAGAQLPVVGYGGMDIRFRPVSPLKLDLTLNPDFSQVTPDAAITNLDQFAVFFPEVRPFFVEDRFRFTFGATTTETLGVFASSSERYQLFYSRRIGLQQERANRFLEAPLLYGAKAVFRAGGFELGMLNVQAAGEAEYPEAGTNVTVARVNRGFGGANRVGAIVLNKAHRRDLGLSIRGPQGYRAYGLDGAVGFVSDRLVLSGFAVASESNAAGGVTRTRPEPGLAVNGTAEWSSRAFEARLTYYDIGTMFDPQLGFFDRVGIRRGDVSAAFKPPVNLDEIKYVQAGGLLTRTFDREDRLIVERATVLLGAATVDNSFLFTSFTQSRDVLSAPLPLAGGRLSVPEGSYPASSVAVDFVSPIRRLFGVSLGYREGGLYDGHQRSVSPKIGINVGPFSLVALYELMYLRIGPTVISSLRSPSLFGHRVSSRLNLSLTPNTGTSLTVEANTFDPRATAQLVSYFRFGERGEVSLIVIGRAPSVGEWTRALDLRANLRLTYGFSIF